MKPKRSGTEASRSWPRPWALGEQDPDDALVAALLQQAAQGEPRPPKGMQERVFHALRSGSQRSSRWRLVWASALLGLLCAAGVATWSILANPVPPSSVTNIKVVRGWVTLDGRKLDASHPPQDFCSGCELAVAPEALSSAEIDGGGRVVFLSRSRVSLPARRQSNDLLTLELAEGRVLVRFDARSGRRLVVETRDAEVRVTGTLFGVETGSDAEGTRVSVYQGSVEVACEDGLFRVQAPSSFACPGRILGPAPPPLGTPEAALVGLAPAPPLSPTAPVRTPVLSSPSLQPPPVAPERLAAASPPARKGLGQPAPREPESTPSARPVVLRDAAVPAPPSPPLSWPEREAELLRLARSDGAHAADALFSLGALRYDLTGDVRGARDAWQEYLRRFPAGRLRGEVHLALFEAERSLGRFSQAIDHAQRALEHIRDPGRARKLKLGMAEIYHVHQGALDRAVDLYREVADGRDATSDRASYLLIDCLVRLDRPAKARAAIEAYLARFPAGRFRSLAQQAQEKLVEKNEGNDRRRHSRSGWLESERQPASIRRIHETETRN